MLEGLSVSSLSDRNPNRDGNDSSVYTHLCRLARFGANISDAHTCSIFIPLQVLAACSELAESQKRSTSDSLVLGGFHSLSDAIVRDSTLPLDSGLVGWVAKHRQPIHVSPFEHDSRTLGMYASDQSLKSFVGIPILFRSREQHRNVAGVVACDSKKSFAFSKLQGKLLSDLAEEVTSTLELLIETHSSESSEDSFETFTHRMVSLVQSLGEHSIDILRMQLCNSAALEQSRGIHGWQDAVDQVQRLIQQTLPPLFPSLRLPNGDIVIALDNMMSGFYENKIQVICQHLGTQLTAPQFAFGKVPLAPWNGDLEKAITAAGARAAPLENRSPDSRSAPVKKYGNR